jgi:putative oxidoreductase
VGGFFIGHGTQKLFGWFGGHGPEVTGQFFEQLGLRPGKVHARAAGIAEAGGGALIALGALTPLGAAAITGAMLTAIERAHATKGPWITNGGYEYNAVLIAAALALAETGPGRLSLEGARGHERKGAGWALAALAAGAGGALAVRQISPAEAQPAEEHAAASNGTEASAGPSETGAASGV